MAQAAVSDVAGHWPATTGHWLLASRSEKTMAGGSSSHVTFVIQKNPKIEQYVMKRLCTGHGVSYPCLSAAFLSWGC